MVTLPLHAEDHLKRFLLIITLSLSESITETCSVVPTFGSVNKILWWGGGVNPGKKGLKTDKKK